ncbi:MAG: hypothetical protein U0I48_08605 [Acutalibacteraceae bacterium]|nr:hypothetical protein [Acutalibacteraceae bacterium]
MERRKENELENLLLAYMMNKEQRLINEITQKQNTILFYRRCDNEQHLHFIEDNAKLEAVQEVFADVRKLIYNYLDVRKTTR